METFASTPLDRLATPEDKNTEHAPAGIALPKQLFNRSRFIDLKSIASASIRVICV